MSKIIIESPLRTLSRLEHAREQDFESQVLRCAGPLFPDYISGLWKPRIKDGFGKGAQPDAVLVSTELSLWYVVEIELVSHPVTTHVRPQLETLSEGIYDSTLVPSLQKAVPSVPTEVLESLVYKKPGLLCIADGYSEGLRAACSDNGFELAVLEPFRGDAGSWALHTAHLASPMRPSLSANTFQLRRGRVHGDKEFLELPSHFPIIAGVVSIVDPGSNVHECQVHHSSPSSYLLLPTDMAPRGKSLSLSMIDRRQRKLRLEVA